MTQVDCPRLISSNYEEIIIRFSVNILIVFHEVNVLGTKTFLCLGCIIGMRYFFYLSSLLS